MRWSSNCPTAFSRSSCHRFCKVNYEDLKKGEGGKEVGRRPLAAPPGTRFWQVSTLVYHFRSHYIQDFPESVPVHYIEDFSEFVPIHYTKDFPEFVDFPEIFPPFRPPTPRWVAAVPWY